MARYPCDATLHRYREKQQTMYPALLSRAIAQRRMLRLCPEHYMGFRSQLVMTAQLTVDDDESPPISTCALCSQEVTGQSASFFVTAYGTGLEREDWYGVVHEDCIDALAEDWLLPPRMP